MKECIAYSKEDTVQNINDRFLKTVKNNVRQALEKVPAEQRIEILISDDATFRILREFEIYYRIIFGSQLALLMKMFLDNELFSQDEMKRIFQEQLLQRKIDFDVDFDKWLNFLLGQELITLKKANMPALAASLLGNLYTITDKGVAFLTFIKNNNYDMKETGL